MADVGAEHDTGEDALKTGMPRKAKRRRRAGVVDPPATTAAEPRGGATSSSSIFQTDSSFAKLGLARWLTETCEKMGMNYPTDCQVMCIPPILAGRNIAGNAKTGSGKTACYCLPTLHHLSKDPYGVFALVLTPVRELAFQVSENFRALGKNIGVKVVEVVGGREMLHQSKMISERVHVVVATPGRLADLLRGDPALTEAFEGLRIFVLDEADKLLTQTFEEPLAEILQSVPKTRQTLLFSATITKSIERLRTNLANGAADGTGSKELLLLNSNPNEETLSNLTQQYIFVPKTVQACYVHYLLKAHFPEESCIVFTSTIDLCQLFTTMLEFLGFSVTGLHSLHSQRHRQACLNKFRAGQARILVATDVAGRGLDIPKVAVVLNVGLPLEPDDYVHRAGRTARAGRPGLVVSLMTEHDVPKVHAIERRIGCQLELRQSSEDDAVKLLSKTTKARQRAELLLSEVGFEEKAQEHRAARQGKRKARPKDVEKNM
jgi:ATP-dependent RNA helicase DDX49/DBP8